MLGGADLFLFASLSIIMDAVQGSVVLSGVPKTNGRRSWGCSGVSGVTGADVDPARTGVRSNESGSGTLRPGGCVVDEGDDFEEWGTV